MHICHHLANKFLILTLTLSRTAARRFFFLVAFIALAVIIYFPNLDSPFLLDDWANLSALDQFRPPYTYANLLQFLATNNSGSLGRPLSLLSLALQAEYWPNNPFAFKSVNFFIHLANTFLIILLGHFLIRPLPLSIPTKRWLPLFIGSLWLIQPIHVSTVLYAVQRMTLLMAFFSLLSLCGYLYGRAYCSKNIKAGYFIGTFSLILGLTLAIFSKENGALLIVFIAVIELTLFNKVAKPKYWNNWLILFIVLPIVFSSVYIVMHFQSFVDGHAGRNYSLSEHLLTETRILVDYIQKILFPRPNAFGLFFDDYPISKSLFSPLSTFICAGLLVILLLCAWTVRQQQAVFSFAVLWFFAGHLIESTIIPLELYFEHRNYLPSFGICFGLSYYCFFFIEKASASHVKSFFSSLAVLYGLGIGLISYQAASLWGNPNQQALIWQSNHTQSKRANELAYQTWLDLNNPLTADFYLQNISVIDKQDSAAYIMRLELHCHINHISSQDQSNILDLLQQTKTDNATALSAKSIVDQWISDKCQNLTSAYLEQIQLIVLSHASGYQKTHLASTLSLFYAYQNQYPSAISILDETIKTSNTAELILLKIRWGIASKQYDKALSWIEEAKNNKGFPFLISLNFKNQLTKMEQDIKTLQTSSLNVMQ